MKPIDADVWDRLRESSPKGETLWARLAAPEVSDRLFAAVDSSGVRHLLIRLTSEESGLTDTQSRGLQVETRELMLKDLGTGRFLDLACADPAGNSAFDLIGGDLAAELAAKLHDAPRCAALVLSKWRRFWGNLPRQVLSREEQLGLFGELWFLSFWLTEHVGVAEALRRWRGPYAARHDFEWVGKSVEVKTTSASSRHVHQISGIEQLAPPETGELLFFSLRVREEAGASNSLPALVVTCRKKVDEDDEARSLFEAAMERLGYSDGHLEEYARLRLRITGENLYGVNNDFPRLTPLRLKDGLPQGVGNVRYEIDLGGFDHLCLARTPSVAMMIG
jgi:hypothetical protein